MPAPKPIPGVPDPWAWPSAVIIGVVFAAIAMLVTLTWFPVLHGVPGWNVPGDIWMATDSGRQVWNGALGYVYDIRWASYALPLGYIVIAPAVGLADHLNLVEGAPMSIPHPTAWLVIGPYVLLLGIVLLHAIRGIARDLGLSRYLWRIQILAAVVVLGPSAAWNHFEDVLALAFLLYAVRSAWRGRTASSALLLGISVSFKQWSVVALPFLLLQLPPGTRLRYVLKAGWLPVSLAAFCLGVDWTHASRHLLEPTIVPENMDLGHHAVFARVLGRDTSRLSRVTELALSPVVAWRSRHLSDRSSLLIAIGVVLLARPILEPYNYGYYWSPGVILIVVGVAARRGSLGIRTWGWAFLLTAWVAPGDTSSAGWWSGVLVILSAWAWTAIRPGRTLTTEAKLSIDAEWERAQLAAPGDEDFIASGALDNDNFSGSVSGSREGLEDSATVTSAKPRGSNWLAPAAHMSQSSTQVRKQHAEVHQAAHRS